jgi:predicted GNAT family acetyltransferase
VTNEAFTAIEHQPQSQRFVLPMVEGGCEVIAIVNYEVTGSTVNFTHTWVPPELRGGGHAQVLVRHALSWAETQGLQITASCWYVRKFL